MVHVATGDRAARMAEHRRDGRLGAAQHVGRRGEAVPQGVQGNTLEPCARGDPIQALPRSLYGAPLSVANTALLLGWRRVAASKSIAGLPSGRSE